MCRKKGGKEEREREGGREGRRERETFIFPICGLLFPVICGLLHCT